MFRPKTAATISCRCCPAGPTCLPYPGKRTTGTGAAYFAITGPGLVGNAAVLGTQAVDKAPTSIVWVLGAHLIDRLAGR